MNAHQFAKLSQLARLEHVASAKRVVIKSQTCVDPKTMDLTNGYRCHLKGICVGPLHATKEQAKRAGKKLLTKFQTEAKALGLTPN